MHGLVTLRAKGYQVVCYVRPLVRPVDNVVSMDTVPIVTVAALPSITFKDRPRDIQLALLY